MTSSNRRIDLILGLAVAGWFGGCGEGDRFQDDMLFSTTDSAGVRLVWNQAHDDWEGPQWTVNPEPSLVLGSDEVEGPELFGTLGGVVLHPNNSLWVSDLLAREIRIFDASTGEHLATKGGNGEGPGEFRSLRPLGIDSERRVVYWDQRLRRVSTFSEEGEFLTSYGLGQEAGLSPLPFHVSPDGSLVGQIPQGIRGGFSEGDVLSDTLRLWIIEDQDGDPKLAVKRRSAKWVMGEQVQALVPFSEGARFAFSGSRIYLTDQDGDAGYDVVEGTTLISRVRVDRPRQEVTPELIQQRLDQLGGTRWGDQQADLLRTNLSRVPIPSKLPEWDRLLVDEGGYVWAERYRSSEESPQTWDVFDSSGRLLGPISLPPGLLVHQVTRDRVIATVKDEHDLQSVAIYEIHRAGLVG